MSTESGHHTGQHYYDHNGDMHLNGSHIFDSNENDLVAALATVQTNQAADEANIAALQALKTVVAPATGYKIARGVAAITGSGTVVTGLATVVAVIATLQDDAALTGNIVTATIGDQAGAPAAGSVILKVWKPTANNDCTPIAATAAKNVNWFAIGT